MKRHMSTEGTKNNYRHSPADVSGFPQVIMDNCFSLHPASILRICFRVFRGLWFFTEYNNHPWYHPTLANPDICLMKNLPHHLAAFATVLWVGGLWAIGYLAVPVLFQGQPDRQLAGMLAGQMFSTLGYLGMVCGVYLLILRLATDGKAAIRQPMFWVIAAMLLFTLLAQYGFQPLMAALKAQALPQEVSQSPLAGQFRMWHGISSIAYLLQSLLGAFLVIRKS